MGGMMGTSMYGWVLLYSLLGLILIVGSGLLVVRAAGRRSLPPAGPTRSVSAPQADEAQAALRRRYAAGEISREDYLQAKVELED